MHGEKSEVRVESGGSGLSYFNDEQQEETRYLASLKPEAKCWCGWYRAGECGTPNPCAQSDTMADRQEVTCDECGGYPHKPGARLVHRRGCPHDFRTSRGPNDAAVFTR